MTLVVKNEEDILENNICFHLNNGVDFIYAIDNGSSDGTTDILEKYRKLGFLSYRIETSKEWKQDVWTSELSNKALNLYGATHVIHSDADEFWYTKSGNIKNVIKNADVMFVPVLNYIPPTIVNQNKMMFERFKYVVTKTTPCPGEVGKRESHNLLFYEYPRKVLTKSKFVNIGRGNDTVLYKGRYKIENISCEDLVIHHFPIRSYSEFEKKVIRTGSGYEKTKTDDSTGWHAKSWYKIYKDGNLHDEYDKLSLKNKKVKKFLKEGVIENAHIPESISESINIFKSFNDK